MSGPVRDPDELLAELGAELRAGYAAADRGERPGRRLPWRRMAVGALAVTAAVSASSAIADRNLFGRAPAIPELPAPLRADRVPPDRDTPPAYIARGAVAGVTWRLAASSCEYGQVRVVAAFLTVPGGGAGTRCDIANEPRAQTYYDALTDRTWVFGVVSGAATDVLVRGGRVVVVQALELDPDGADGAGLPEDLRSFVTALPGVVEAVTVTVRAAGARPILRCDQRRCTPEETP